MEKLYKYISAYLQDLVYTLVSLLKITLFSSKNSKLPKNTRTRVIVLANGPSFNKIYKSEKQLFLDNECIVSNTFPLSDHFLEIKPKYLVWIDQHMWKSQNKAVVDTHMILKNNVTWEMNLLVPRFSKKNNDRIQDIQNTNSNIKITYYNYYYYKGFTSIGHYLYKSNLSFPRAWNVTIASLFLSINLGFETIYLIGADHTWHENLHMDQNNILHTKVEHFFEDKKEVKYMPFYRGGIEENGTNSAKDFFWIWSKTFEGYESVKKYADYRNVRIFNSSPESFIDAFPRKKITNINT